MEKQLPAGIYGITAEKFSNGRSNINVVREMIRGGVSVIQYREKYASKPIREIYEECLAIREMTRSAGVMFIVNDFIDIALLVDADGVHVGQGDLPVTAVRKLVGNKLIGLSTHTGTGPGGAHRRRGLYRRGADFRNADQRGCLRTGGAGLSGVCR